MNRFRIFFGMVLVIGAFFAASNARAEMYHKDMTGRWGIGGQVLGAVPVDSDQDGTAYVGGQVLYGVMDHVAVGVEAGFMDFDVDDEGTDFGDLTGAPLFAVIQIRYPFDFWGSNATAFGTIGIGGIFWDFSEDEILDNAGIEVDVDNAFAAKFGGGIDFWIDDNWVASFEAAYVLSDTGVTLRAPAGSAVVMDDIDTDYWTIGGGVRYTI